MAGTSDSWPPAGRPRLGRAGESHSQLFRAGGVLTAAWLRGGPRLLPQPTPPPGPHPVSGSPLPQQLLHVLAHLPAVQQPLQQRLIAGVGREVPALEHGTDGRVRVGARTDWRLGERSLQRWGLTRLSASRPHSQTGAGLQERASRRHTVGPPSADVQVCEPHTSFELPGRGAAGPTRDPVTTALQGAQCGLLPSPSR